MTSSELSFEPLTPVAFVERAASVFADRLAVVSGERLFSYREHWNRTLRQAGLWRSLGVGADDRVGVLSPNSHVVLEAHTGVPLAGAVLVALNTRLSAGEIAQILAHAQPKVLLVDHELEDLARNAVDRLGVDLHVLVAGTPAGVDDPYETALAKAPPFRVPLEDERSLLAINYTSGTTGTPKGVMYHHRGAYLQALAMAFHARLTVSSRYLWTLPMFHTNGWCFPWAISAAGAVHVCLRRPDPKEIWRNIEVHRITHMSAAPTVLSSMEAFPDRPERVDPPIAVMTGGAPPTPALLERFETMNMSILHLYGLTESFGPAVLNDWHPEWDDLSADERARLKSRQGVSNVVSQPVRVLDDEGLDVPADGVTQGEIALRGNNVMLGYYLDPEATAAAAPDGHFRTGDVGVMHPDGYIELRDRSKDIIISGGENIASVEVESALASHPAVLEAAVVARPDEKWGEVPVAFVTLRESGAVTEAELIQHVRDRLAHFKTPKAVMFASLPRTSTGKIQKNVLRQSVNAGAAPVPPHSASPPGTPA